MKIKLPKQSDIPTFKKLHRQLLKERQKVIDSLRNIDALVKEGNLK